VLAPGALLALASAAHAQAAPPAPAASPVAAASPAPAPEKRFRIASDVGLRSEYIHNEGFAANDTTQKDDHRVRWRARLRFGGEYDLGKSVTAGLRLSTGDNSYPSSGWSSFSDSFRRDLIQVDRAYVNWQASRDVQIRVGAEANPLFTPTEMLWDADVQPAGLAEVLKAGKSGLVLTAGQFMLREYRTRSASNDENSWLFANGLAYTPSSLKAVKLTVGLSHYAYNNPDVVARSLQLGELDSDFKSNRFDPRGRVLPGTTTPADYFSRFHILNAGMRLEGARTPWSLAADAALNTSARADATLGPAFAKKSGFAAGGLLGYRFTNTVKNREVTIRAGFFHIEPDAVLAVFNNDDLQQTNVNSVPVDILVRLPGGVRLGWDTYFQKRIDVNIPSAGVGHRENALKVRSRLTVSAGF
jgi:Putative porin